MTSFAILAALAAAAQPVPPPAGVEAQIPNVRSDGVQEWQADGKLGLFIRSIDGDWYYARTLGSCGRLRTALSLGFETRGVDQLDRHGAVIAEGWRCPLASVTRSDPPPRKKRR